ncbi:MAG TPA: hypothetical protein VK506_06350, partial [Conexibacter sp.]|nr:hypothetical protein [Conexibacter sp.]
MAFLFFAITGAAIGVLYLYIAPQLESRLRDEKVTQLRDGAQATVRSLDRVAGTGVNARLIAP